MSKIKKATKIFPFESGQSTIGLPPEVIKRLGWGKETPVIITTIRVTSDSKGVIIKEYGIDESVDWGTRDKRLIKAEERAEFRETFGFEPPMHKFPILVGNPIILDLRAVGEKFEEVVPDYDDDKKTYYDEKKDVLHQEISAFQMVNLRFGKEAGRVFQRLQ